MKLRVLLADDRLGYERAGLHGGGRFMITLTRAMLERGIDVTAVLLRDPGELRASVGDLPFVFLGRHEFDPRTLTDLVSLVRRHNVDLLHVQGHGASMFGRLAGMLTRRPVIVHVHADYRLSPKGYPSYVRMADRGLGRATVKVLAISEAIRTFAIDVQGYRPEQVEVLYNPIDLGRFQPPTPQERLAVRAELGLGMAAPVVVTVGRLDKLKGVDVQVEAWPRVAAACAGATLLVVGDGPERQTLELQATAKASDGSIRFLGRRSDVERLLRAADVAVLSSRQEGLGLSLLEAMATGIPVVATRVGGIPEIVSEDRNGLLVPPDDAVALSEAIIRLLSDDSSRQRMSREAQVTVQRFSQDVVMQRLIGIYHSVLPALDPAAVLG
jgi:glycosyltransferase involved in cell wall biosynthesis